jgi:hypothetical protein
MHALRSAREVGVRLGSMAIKSIGVLNWPRRKVWGAGNGPVIVLGVIHHGRWKEQLGERDWASAAARAQVGRRGGAGAASAELGGSIQAPGRTCPALRKPLGNSYCVALTARVKGHGQGRRQWRDSARPL